MNTIYNTIYHITQSHQWENAKQVGSYSIESLQTEGFIHCSTLQQIIKVANRFFSNQKGLVILCINSDNVNPEIKYESADGDEYPHIYGELNIDAVYKVIDFESNEKGLFILPNEI